MNYLNTIFLFGLLVSAIFTSGCLKRETVIKEVIVDNDNGGGNGGNGDGSGNGSGTGDGSGSGNGDGSGDGSGTGALDYNHPACRTGSPPGVADGGQTVDYHKVGTLPVIIARGSAPPNRWADFHPGGVVWNSKDDMPSNISQDIFTTNSRFNLRVKALTGIQGVNDSRGIPCNFVPLPYKKLNIGVRVRRRDAVSGDYYHFRDVGVNQFSNVKEFVVPPNVTEPLVIEISDLEWDYSCTHYSLAGHSNVTGYCPYARIWDTQCVRLQFEFATDDTRDIPCPRAY